MSFEENIKFISGQISAFTTMLNDSVRVLEGRRRSVTGARNRLQELRNSTRAYRQALTSAERGASAASRPRRMVVMKVTKRPFREFLEYLDNALENLDRSAREDEEYTVALETTQEGHLPAG